MQNFPASTSFDKVIPKAKFYEKLPVSPGVKRAFVNDIAQIVWRNKLSPETLNVRAGSRVSELEVLEIELKRTELNASVLKVIDRGIPYQLLFLLKRGEEYQVWIGYKGNGSLPDREYFHTEWMSFDELPVQITGLTMDEICDNFIRQIHGDLPVGDTGDLKSELTVDRERKKLQQKIAQLEKRLLNEKQFKKQMEIQRQINECRREIGNE